MLKRYTLFLVIVLVIVLIGTSCSNDDEPVDVSIDGALLETGLEIDENREIIETGSSFSANQDFYFYFHNNQPFGTDRVTVQLIDNRNSNVLAEHTYEVDPDEYTLTDGIFFGNSGSYAVSVLIHGQVRATRQVTIE
jgi:hypothetical protein